MQSLAVGRFGVLRGDPVAETLEVRGVALDEFIDRIKKERDSKTLPADFSQHEPSAGDAIA